MKNNNKDNSEKLLFDKYHIYDVIIVGGTAALIVGLLFLATVFTGTLSMGRASVILGIVFIIAGSILIGNGKVIKKTALGEPDDFYEDYITKKESSQADPGEKE